MKKIFTRLSVSIIVFCLCPPAGYAQYANGPGRAFAAEQTQAPLRERNVAAGSSSYFGGANEDVIFDVCADTDGNRYLTGYTKSLDFPVVNAFQANSRDGFDAFLVKLSPENTVMWSTYFGGSDPEYGMKVMVGANGDVYLAGTTWSSDLPTMYAYQCRNGGATDGFVSKFSPDGALQWTTYIGGSAYDGLYSMDIASNGNIIVCGETYSGDYPRIGAGSAEISGECDISISELTGAGQLVWSTFFGGADRDWGTAIRFLRDGGIVLVGRTKSRDMPVVNAFQPGFGGGEYDMYVVCLNADKTMRWASYYGGLGDELTHTCDAEMTRHWGDVELDAEGNIVFCGWTNGDALPEEAPLQPRRGGGYDGTIAVVSNQGELLMSSYYGGSKDDYLLSISRTGEVIAFAGITSSADYPLKNAVQDGPAGKKDAVVSVFDSDFKLLHATCYGGSDIDEANAIEVQGESIFIGGTTKSPDFPTVEPIQESPGGEWDGAFVEYGLVDAVSGIESNPVPMQLSLWPNPTVSRVTFVMPSDCAGSVRIRIQNTMGRTVYEDEGASLLANRTLTVNVTQLPSGIYFVRASAGGDIFSARFAKI